MTYKKKKIPDREKVLTLQKPVQILKKKYQTFNPR